ncbi:AraC family transcriptional regulator [Sulfurimonas sp. MAG313]|nr:AraC family transcriptional regulator [Sulfurimonas sp. MAG313]MDF1881592.1 AraC family transcriptional regulator [Sulfurimonas sp. MAG313]
MNSQIQKVTYFIENHLDNELDVVTLAKVAGYSHFHFCRIFKIHIGESAISYATRLKLERAASQLMSENKSIIEVALHAGYQTPTGFLRAFKTRFGTTPTAYKRSTILLLNQYKDIKINTAQIVERECVDVVFVRELGEYQKSSDNAWKKLTAQMNALEKKLNIQPPKRKMELGMGNCEALGICHDDPKITNEENIRYDAALAWEKEDVAELVNYGFDTKTIAGGKYAKVFYKGVSQGEDAWYGLYAWIEKNEYTCRDEPSFEKYLNGTTETDLEKFEVEIYVPIV